MVIHFNPCILRAFETAAVLRYRTGLPAAELQAKAAFCAVARKYRRAVSFLYGDGKRTYREKKKVRSDCLSTYKHKSAQLHGFKCMANGIGCVHTASCTIDIFE